MDRLNRFLFGAAMLIVTAMLLFQLWVTYAPDSDDAGPGPESASFVSIFLPLVMIVLAIAAFILFFMEKKGGTMLLFAAAVLGLIWLLGTNNVLQTTRNLLSGTNSSELRTFHNAYVHIPQGGEKRFIASGRIRLNNYYGWKLCIQPAGRFDLDSKDNNLNIWIEAKSKQPERVIVSSMLPYKMC